VLFHFASHPRRFDPAQYAINAWATALFGCDPDWSEIESIVEEHGAHPTWAQLAAGLVEQDGLSEALLELLRETGFCGPEASEEERSAWLAENGGPDGARTDAERALYDLHHDLVYTNGATTQRAHGLWVVTEPAERIQRLLVAAGWSANAELGE
jgi:hypothetical protein